MGILDKVRPNLPIQALPKEPTEKREKAVKGTKAITSSKNAIKTKVSLPSYLYKQNNTCQVSFFKHEKKIYI